MTARRLGTAVAAVLALLLALVLLWPDGYVVNRAVVRVYVFFLERGMPQAVTPEHYATLLNVLAFVPLGWLGVAALRRRIVTTVLVLGGLSALVELVQLLPLLGREASVLDVVCNTGGALLGAVLGSLTRHEPRRDQPLDETEHPVADDLR